MAEKSSIEITQIEEILNNKYMDTITKDINQEKSDKEEMKFEKVINGITEDKVSGVIENTNQVVVKKTYIINKDSESFEHTTATQENIDGNEKSSKLNCDVDIKLSGSVESCHNTPHNSRPSGILISLPKKSIYTVRPETRSSKLSGINITFKNSVSRTKHQPEEVNTESTELAGTNKDETANMSNIKKVGRMKKAFLNLRSKLNKMF